jgi:predicted negative regulator of RcsB-dependent stress response
MKNRIIILLSVGAIVLVSLAVFLFIWNGSRKVNKQLYARILDKCEEGGQAHTLIPDIEHLLSRPFLQENIANNANILAASIFRKIKEYDRADRSLKDVKLVGSVNDIQDHIYYLWGMNQWEWFGETKDTARLEEAKTYFRRVVDTKESPFNRNALLWWIKSCFYSNDFSFADSVPADFSTEIAQFSKRDLPEYLYIMAKANLHNNRRKEGVDQLITLWKNHPESEWMDKAEELLTELGESSAIRYPKLSAGELLDINDQMFEMRSGDKKKLNYIRDHLADFSQDLRGDLLDKSDLLLGKVCVRLGGRYGGDADRYLAKAYDSDDIDIRMQAALYQILKATQDGQLSRIAGVAALVSGSKYLASRYYEECAYRAGYPFMRQRRYSEAVKLYTNILRKPDPASNRFYGQALWRLHWCYFHLEEYDEALSILEKMMALRDWREYATYWMGAIYQKLGKSVEAQTLYTEVLKNYGNTYYGILAGVVLENTYHLRVDLEKDRQDFQPLKVGLIENPAIDKRFNALKENGLFEFAAAELQAYLKEQGISRKENEQNWRPYGSELSKLYFNSGQYINAGLNIYWTYREDIDKDSRNIPDWLWKIYYPLFYKDIIDRYADRYGVERKFLYAFIRQESFFEPTVESSAGAIGVMQIIPTTGEAIFKEIKSELGSSAYSMQLLYRPEINIPMGIFHLRKQLYEKIEAYISQRNIRQAMNKDLYTTLTIAGYNAGIGSAFRWVREIEFENQQELVDQIDYEETRDYVKLVLKHIIIYNRKVEN